MSRTFDLSYLIGDLNPTRPVIWIISKNSSTFPEVNWGTELWACHHLSHDQAGPQTWSHSWSLDPPHKTWGTKKAYGPGLCCQSLRSKTRLTLGVQYNVDLRSCWFRRRWPAALPYVHSAHLFLKPNATLSIHPSTILCKRNIQKSTWDLRRKVQILVLAWFPPRSRGSNGGSAHWDACLHFTKCVWSLHESAHICDEPGWGVEWRQGGGRIPDLDTGP